MNNWVRCNEQLLEAIARKDLGGMMSCIQKGAHINRICLNGMTPLGAAAETGSLYVLQVLTDYSKQHLIDCSNENTRPINLSLDQRREKKTKNIGYFVVNREIDENEIDDNGTTPEGMEGLEWDMEICEAEDQELRSPMEGQLYKWYANILNRTSVILKSPENDIARLDRHGQNVLHYAVQDGHIDMVEYLLTEFKEFNVNQCNLSWHTPLHLATIRGNYEIMKYLIEKGGDVNAATMNKQTPLHFAAQRNNVEVVQLLLDKGANVNVYDTEDRSPLTMAVLNSSLEITKLLLKKGARLNQEETNGYTVLYRAVWKDLTTIAKHLIEGGAKIVHSQYLLHMATRNGNLEMVKILHRGGAILNLRDDQGNTPLMVACMGYSYTIAEYLLQNGVSSNTINQINGLSPLHIVLGQIRYCQTLEMFLSLLIHHKANLNIATHQGNLFFYSLINNNLDGAKLLIKYGIDVNRCDEYSYCDFLTLAKKHGDLHLVKLVVNAGFDFKKNGFSLRTLNLNENDPVYQYIAQRMRNFPSLKELCRKCVRYYFCQQHVYQEISKTGLPVTLERYITLDCVS